MSLKAIVWVMEEAPVTNHGHLALLYALADRANDDGQAAWPSQSWLAERCRVSDRTVRNYLRELEKAGIIRRGDQSFVDHLDARRRPVVWDIVMDSRPEEDVLDRKDYPPIDDFRPENSAAFRPEVDRKNIPAKSYGRKSDVVLAGSLSSDKPSIEPSIKDITPYSPPNCSDGLVQASQGDPQAGTPTKKPTKNQLDEEFEFFWARVEKKRAKQQSRKSFEKQRRTHSLDFICSQLEKAQAEWRRAGRDPQYWPHPSTWLNQQLEDDYEIVQAPPAQQSHIGGYYGAAERLRQKLAGGEPTWELT